MMKTIAMEKTEETLELGVEPSLIRKRRSRAVVEPPHSTPPPHPLRYVSRPISSLCGSCLFLSVPIHDRASFCLSLRLHPYRFLLAP